MNSSPRTLIVTNDFPPRQGGIQSYVHELARRMPAGDVVVYTSDYPGAAAFDAAQPFPVVRHGGGLLLPTPAVRARVPAVLRDFECSSVWFGASAPLGLLAPVLRRAGAERIVASAHGHEAGWAMLPAARQALRRIGGAVDVITYLSEYFRPRFASAFGSHPHLVRLSPGVDIETFTPDIDSSMVRESLGLTGRPIIVCVSRLVRRKGQDVLIEALPAVRAAVADATLLLVGDGPDRERLRAQAVRRGVADAVVFTRGVSHADLPAHYAAGDVFAMPCRTRRAGMDIEGLGMVFLEASACGLPVVVGDSGGAPEAVRDGESGHLVDGRDPAGIATRLITLLRDDALRARLGAAGRRWVEQDWRWDSRSHQLGELLRG